MRHDYCLKKWVNYEVDAGPPDYHYCHLSEDHEGPCECDCGAQDVGEDDASDEED